MIESLKELIEAQGDADFVYFDKAKAEELATEGFAEVNASMVDQGMIATRVTQAGRSQVKRKSMFDAAIEEACDRVEVSQPEEPKKEQTAMDYARKFISGVGVVTKSTLAKGIGIAPAAAKKLIDGLVESGELVPGTKKGQYVVAVEVTEVDEPEPSESLFDKPVDFSTAEDAQPVADTSGFNGLTEAEEKETASVKGIVGKTPIVEIDSDIPVPTKRKRVSNFPNLGQLEVGQSFWFAIDEALKDPKSSIASRVTRWKKDSELNPEKRDFTTLMVDDKDPRGVGIRVWRIS